MQSTQLRYIVALLLTSLPLTGCQTTGNAGLITSSVTTELTAEAAAAIAGDLVGRLAEQVGPGGATIQLQTDGTAFGQALEASLKGGGYAVVTDQKTEGGAMVAVAYTIDGLQGNVIARLSMPSLELTRIYQLGANGAVPISPLSVMHRSAGHSG
ncbi:conjugal transfer protein TrbH [Mesorhizobium sp. CAU 1741]|uniref:conjugal transfer protein TrbH n=1 Tax=Mesorhizobium sp. CAU 1741 TaxID=3140366 RepID=UPI00325BF5CE